MAKNIRPGSVMVLDRNGSTTGVAGTFMYLLDEHRQINCNMDFADYPMDTHVCYFRILSAVYNQNKMVTFLINIIFKLKILNFTLDLLTELY